MTGSSVLMAGDEAAMFRLVERVLKRVLIAERGEAALALVDSTSDLLVQVETVLRHAKPQ